MPAKSPMLSQYTDPQDSAQHLRACPRRRPIVGRHRSLRTVTARSQAHRDEVRALETHPAARTASPAWPARRTGRVRAGGYRPEPQTPSEADHPPAAAILRCPCCADLGSKVSGSVKSAIGIGAWTGSPIANGGSAPTFATLSANTGNRAASFDHL